MPEIDANKNGDWGEYRRLLISELERLDRTVSDLVEQIDRRDADMRTYCGSLVAAIRSEIEALRTRLTQLDVNSTRISHLETECGERRQDVSRIDKEVTALVVKSGLWGAAGGLIPAIGALIWWLASR